MKNIENFYPLSPMQEGMLFHTLYAPGSDVYIEQSHWTIHADLDVNAFERAWQRVIDRHAILRSGFIWEGVNEPIQVVHRQVSFSPSAEDWRGLSPEARQERIKSFLEADKSRGFDLAEPPLMRLALIRAADDRFEFVWTRHHLLLDGWSGSLLMDEVFSFYEAFRAGRDLNPQRSRPYRDYVAWLRRQDLGAAEEFWRSTLSGFTQPTPLRIEREPGAAAEHESQYSEQQIDLSPETTSALQSLSRQRQITPNTIAQGAWALLLSHYSGEDDVVFGAVVSGRDAELPGVESILGLFTNILPVRVKTPPATDLTSWLRQLQAQQIRQRQYEYSPLVQVQRWSNVPQGQRLFDTILVFENHPLSAKLQGQEQLLEAHQLTYSVRTHYPITVTVVPGAQWRISLAYDARSFRPESMTRMLNHLRVLLEEMAKDAERRLIDVPMLPESERAQILHGWSGVESDYPRDRCIHHLFEEQVERTPDLIAVSCGDERVSYKELNRLANQVAAHLRSEGVGPESRVGVCLERSVMTVISLLGILKAGAAYVPLDPSYPQTHLAFILNDTGARVILTSESLLPRLPENIPAVITCLDRDWGLISRQDGENAVTNAVPENLLFVMYTSGSTGQPKGVAVEQKQLLNRFAWMWDEYPFQPGEVLCQRTTVNFTVSIWELLGALLRGAHTAIIPDSEAKDPSLMVRRLASENVTRIVLVPSLLRAILDANVDLRAALPGLKLWSVCGEPLSVALCREFHERLPGAKLLNQYGASEVNDVCCYDTASLAADAPTVPIGRPINNLKVYLLDRYNRPVPVGVPGQLHVSSVNPARGYLNRPDLTAERFVPDPFSPTPGARLYNMGDLARYGPDGQIEYVGRVDHQVKIRGQRVELGEVEAVLKRHPAVREAVVVALEEPAGRRLVAYVAAPGEGQPSASELRSFLGERLPGYMVASAFVFLDRLPRTPNGKVDRKSLPAPDSSRPEMGQEFTPPRNEVEKAVAGVWAEALGIPEVGVHDNFFELGGHSLTAAKIVSRLSEQFELELPLRALFVNPTVAMLAAEIARIEQQKYELENERLLDMLEQLSDEQVLAELKQRTEK
ncbi:MAG TPA: amino acid adenylation domain-containing protein [Blastocatellia bacterium]|nr:amino acid adenylation domain-containing protein [Blastocatellia bacterium]